MAGPGVRTSNIDLATGPLSHVIGVQEVTPGVPGTRKRPVSSLAVDIAAILAARLAPGILWNFDSNTTTAADPGTGDIRFNNASLNSVTELSISDFCGLPGNPDASAFVLSWEDSGATPLGTLYIKKAGAEQNFLIVNVTAINDQSGYTRVSLDFVAGAGSFSNGDPLSLLFVNGGLPPVVEEGAASGIYEWFNFR
jgi:hypothetical protein